MDEIIYFIKPYLPVGKWALFVVSCLLLLRYIIKHPEVVDHWAELYYKYIGFWEKNRSRKIVSSELSYRITNLAKELNKQSDGIIPFGLRIRWTNTDEVSSSVQDDNVILVLKESSNSDKNIVDSILLFTSQALLPKGRNSINKELLDLLDIYSVKKMLFSGNYSSAYNYFIKNILDEKINTNEIESEKINGIQKADEKGFYSRVLLEELKLFSEKYFGTSEEGEHIQETIDYFDFIFSIATRKYGDDTTRLLFLGKTIKIGIVFVAKRDTVNSYYGLDSYVHRTKINFEKGAVRVYLFAHALIIEEYEIDTEGYVIDVYKKASFKYMDYIEKELLKNTNYLLTKSESFQVNIDGYKRMTKLFVVEKRDPTLT